MRELPRRELTPCEMLRLKPPPGEPPLCAPPCDLPMGWPLPVEVASELTLCELHELLELPLHALLLVERPGAEPPSATPSCAKPSHAPA